MAFPVTLNGRTYTLADFSGTNYVEGLPDALEDFVTQAGDIYNSTSSTSNAIGIGSKTFTVEANKPYQAGTPLRIADAAAPATNFMDVIVTSYSGTSLVVSVFGFAGSGTYTSWTVNIGGAKTIDGTLPVVQGGTGATTAADARTNLDTYSKAEADSRFLNVSGEASNVTMTGNVTIGDAGTDTLIVNATATMADATLTTADINGGTIDGTVIGGSTPAAVTASALTVGTAAYPSAGPLSNRNKIINGSMTIDQRNAGAAVTVNAVGSFFPTDRFFGTAQAADGVFTLQQSATAPAGFVNSVITTVTTADASIGATQYYLFNQYIEGHNTADLGWGTASAKPITLSFWTRSSLTGTFGGVISNGGQNRSYPFTYAISAADTWEYKTITIAGDTSGTWLTTNGIGIRLHFDLGVGSTYRGTAGAWAGALYLGATGATDVIGTLSATWYVTGVQLEAGDTATPFEHRSFGAELALCQRYFEKSYNTDVAPGTATFTGVFTNGGVTNLAPANYATRASTAYKVTKRATPTVTTFDTAGNSGKCNYPDSTTNQSYTVIHNGFSTFSAETSTLSGGTDTRCYWHFTSSAEL
jgi:hypothetical protein